MSNKIKAGISILLMSVSFYMMITTKYTRALGDYVLESVGFQSWTGDYTGMHLTIIYFGILFVIGLLLVKKYVTDGLNISGRSIFFIFIALMIVFSSITGMAVRNIKKNSSGLLAIGYNSKDSSMNYRSIDNQFIEFTAKFELTNYSNERKTFFLSIDSPSYREDGIKAVTFYNLNGTRAIFQLEGNETKPFILSSDNYELVGGMQLLNGSGSGTIEEIILENDKGDKVRLVKNDVFGIKLNR